MSAVLINNGLSLERDSAMGHCHREINNDSVWRLVRSLMDVARHEMSDLIHRSLLVYLAASSEPTCMTKNIITEDKNNGNMRALISVHCLTIE
jgi:hypothetical protein